MPISDLLASITGDKSASSTATGKDVRNPAPKRKAEDEMGRPSVKTQRVAPISNGTLRANGTSDALSSRPRVSSLTPTEQGKRTALGTSSSTTDLSTRKASNPLHRNGLSTSPANGTKTTPLGRPSGIAKGLDPARISKPEPKKRSFAEIMARANAAQAASARASLGKIQHKTVERGLSMKERKELMAGEAKGQKATQRLQRGNGKKASSAPSTSARDIRGGNQVARQTGTGTKAKAASTEEKRVRKAAVATTGYTGTARPRPGAPVSKPGQPAERGSEPRRTDRPPYPSALSNSRRRYNDYDADMDDFIEYDDDEEPDYDRRGGHDSMEEDESDMEAGMSDIDLEERRAESFARREDQEQEALEKRLKREKEERKRRQLAELRAKASSR